MPQAVVVRWNGEAMPSQLSCDENGMLIGFPHHDGWLDGVLTCGTEVNLALRSSQGERRVLTLRRVVALQVHDFREGNIVGYLWFLRADQVASRADVQRTPADRLGYNPANLGPDASVFILDSSYGADVIALCGSVEISEIGATLAVAR